MRSFFIHTFGCQMNVRDSERLGACLMEQGHSPQGIASRADLVIFNTCSIRKKAEDKVYSLLGRLEKRKLRDPNLILAVSGCVAEQEGETLLRRFPGLDLVLGPHHVARIPDLLVRAEQGERICAVGPLPDEERLRGYSPFHRNPSVSTFVTIMEGCDNWCSYCVVPALRGPELCRPRKDILREIRDLADRGFREVTLIGQNVNSYRSEDGAGFARLLYSVAEIPEILRIRFATSHPLDLHPDLVDAFAKISNLAHHIHLPVQSGSNRILQLMNRHYTREEYLDKIRRLRISCPDIAVTTDMIVGFPGESDFDFQQTMDLLDEVRFDGSFSFCYSPRPNTRAAALPGRVETAVARVRLREYQARQDEITLGKNQALTEKTFPVLVETAGPSPATGGTFVLTGRTSSNKIVHFSGRKDLIGFLAPVRITRAATHSLQGTIEEKVEHASPR